MYLFVIFNKQLVSIGAYLLILLQHLQLCYGLFDRNFPREDYHRNQYKNLLINNEQLEASLTFAKNQLNKLERLEDTITNSRVKIRNKSPSFAQLLDNLPNEKSKEYDKTAQIVLKASLNLFNTQCVTYGSNNQQCGYDISYYAIPQSDILNKCQLYQHDKKNLNIYRRLLPPNYMDGLYKIPHNQIPSPKNISETLHQLSHRDSLVYSGRTTDEGIIDETKTIALAQWAQFIEHDLVKTVVHTMDNNEPIECCEMDATSPPPRYVHPSCAPLKYVNGHTHECYNYVRSAVGINSKCKFGPAEQLNQASNNLDLSQLYGTSNDVIDSMRSFHNGKLKSTNDPLYPTLPLSTDIQNYCMLNSSNDICYKAGDTRVNLNPYMTTLYTIFLRSHNHIAAALHRENPSWIDEKLFQNAKQINIDIYNKIIFEELLPIILGADLAQQINNEPFLPIDENGAVSNEFATAAIRFYYSMMPGDLYLKTEGIESNDRLKKGLEILKIKNTFYKPRDLSRNSELDRIMQAILTQNAMAMDTGYVGDVSKYMYRYSQLGTDILALDINRGRDHGIPKYVKYLEACQGIVIENWNSLNRFINEKELLKLKSVYSDLSKIDLIIGAIAEKPKIGATVGPTFSCIIGEQLSNTRRTAPHFYSRNTEQKYQKMISQYTGARLMCDCTKLEHVPANIFYKVSANNPLVNCSNLTTMSIIENV